ncbi:ImmA/IrrE family metallo-endopeptidase [Antrihabitans sp. YC3-6]|uniref:ImmA/IrrE family metallo-endopeptidase n=1 Tax=Antrihabitans stalagmiti TaxID=2799499 RepID=A0A934U6V8_9NOCA|nr:ImmA/IrrE family metallo-endopeptidase [Antrihabitans stalagmiti]MBJ8342975.1 ImmA/IrrE family metallo-endopeptidase [Antrihabitans stalagmiti]
MREVAQEERSALGLSDHEPLDPYALAVEHGISVYTLADLRDNGLPLAAVDHFHHLGSSSWSAALIPLGTSRVIVENEAHARVRRRSNIAHELGHHLLEHSFEDVVLGEDHKRQFDSDQENQAKFISGELLIPDVAARRAAYDDWDNARVARAFDVSEQFAQMRMYGARVIAARAARKFGITR